eukprot:scaffold264129_cov20-Prasinocladus_malaysianus.AAC.1
MKLLKKATGGKPGRRIGAHQSSSGGSSAAGDTNSFARLPRNQQISKVWLQSTSLLDYLWSHVMQI